MSASEVAALEAAMGTTGNTGDLTSGTTGNVGDLTTGGGLGGSGVNIGNTDLTSATQDFLDANNVVGVGGTGSSTVMDDGTSGVVSDTIGQRVGVPNVTIEGNGINEFYTYPELGGSTSLQDQAGGSGSVDSQGGFSPGTLTPGASDAGVVGNSGIGDVSFNNIGGGDGGFGGFGGGCPAPWINILLADGGLVKAGDVKPGMQVYTRHETTNEWGVFPVTAMEMGEDERWEVVLEDGRTFVGTFNHRVHTGNDWTEIRDLKAGDKLVQPEGHGIVKYSKQLDHGPIVKITVADAHTYISEGFLSHNIKMGVDSYYDIMQAAGGGLMNPRTINGLSDLGGYSDGGRLLRGPGDGVSDSIPAVIGNKQPARLADGEFVIPARIVSELGNGSTEAGARKLYAMMERIQATRKHSTGKGNVARNTRADKHLPA